MAETYLNKQNVIPQAAGQQNTAPAPEPTVSIQGGDIYRNMIERTKDYLSKEINSLKAEIQKMASEMSRLKVDVAQLKMAGPVRQQSQEQEKEAAPEKQKKLEEKKDGFHPKQGRWNTNDVSVEKMFYYGNKK